MCCLRVQSDVSLDRWVVGRNLRKGAQAYAQFGATRPGEQIRSNAFREATTGGIVLKKISAPRMRSGFVIHKRFVFLVGIPL